MLFVEQHPSPRYIFRLIIKCGLSTSISIIVKDDENFLVKMVSIDDAFVLPDKKKNDARVLNNEVLHRHSISSG